jgi:hypothetical protein
MNPTRTIHLTVHVDEKRRVLIDLPDDTPTGEVEVQLIIPTPQASANGPLTREQVRNRLIAAGLVDPNAQYAPPDAEELSSEERLRIGRMVAGDKTIQQLIDEEREERL